MLTIFALSDVVERSRGLLRDRFRLLLSGGAPQRIEPAKLSF